MVAARLVRDVMRLCLLLERRYAPYGKWLGSAFAQLRIAPELTPSLRAALVAADYPARERSLCVAYEIVAEHHNAAGVTDRVDPSCRRYHGRPYLVPHAERFARALRDTVTDPELHELPSTGCVDQWGDGAQLADRLDAVRATITALA